MLALIAALLMPQSPTPAAGIDRALAQARAATVGNVRYDLAVTISQPVARARIAAAVTFDLAADRRADLPLVLDFGAEAPHAITVNGTAMELVAVADHLIVPASALRPGSNRIALTCESPVAPSGTPLTVYRDAVDDSEYCYTLLVPADAHRLFPCFDQPDIKARFTLRLDLPAQWTAIGNGAATPGDETAGRRLWQFAETAPLPTYLFAFACGPFAVVETPSPQARGMRTDAPMRILVRPSQRPLLDVPAVTRLHRDGLAWLCDYFAVDYPFGKLDTALIPGFPYGGMEHAGAIFYRERAIVFDHKPTDSELARRSTLVYHELSHQWFGNLVTMRWFDDLWLKEGFATFVAYRAMELLEPERRSWLRFLQRVKLRAYEVDGTAGTTPVFQELQNLADAKSAYGPIVYNKAPAVLRELDDRLGSSGFRRGLTRFLTDHAYGNATWQDLARALEDAAHGDLKRWTDRWLLTASMPKVRVRWETDAAGAIARARLEQEPVAGSGTWPLRVELLAGGDDGSWQRTVVATDTATTEIADLVGRRGVRCIVANPGDIAYGQFLPDPTSRRWMVENAKGVADPLLRAVMVATTFEAVREAEFAPAEFAGMAIALVEIERDPDTHAWLLELLATCLDRYVDDQRGEAMRARATEVLLGQLARDAGDGRGLATFRFLARRGVGPAVQGLCRAAAGGAVEPKLMKGLSLGTEDRFLALAALLGQGDAEADAIERDLVAAHAGEDLGRERFLAHAATATSAVKADYFAQYLHPDAPPEQWAQDSLPWFHWPGQEELTFPYLQKALEQAQWVKAHRRIFFMPAWLDAFVNGHADARALAVVDEFLASASIDEDIRKKLLQSRDGLARAVRIRAAFPAPR